MKTRFLMSDLDEVATENQEFFERSDNCNFLILGASGFIGSWITQSILYANEKLNLNLKVTAVCRAKEKFYSRVNCTQKSNLNLIEGDLNSIDLRSFLIDESFDYVLHTATSTTVKLGEPKESLLSSTIATRKIIEFLRGQEKKSKFIHLISGAVYGKLAQNNLHIEESLVIGNSLNEYALCKLTIERLLIEASDQGVIYGSSPRLFAFYGPHLPIDAQLAIGNFMHDAKYNKRIIVKGNPNTTRSYLYPTDLVSWILALWLNPPNYVTHIGSSKSITIGALANSVSKVYGGVPIVFENPNQEVSHYVPKTEIIEKNFGVSQKVSLDDGLARWKSWLESN